MRHHMNKQVDVLTGALYDHWNSVFIPQYMLLWPGHTQSEHWHLLMFDLDVINNKKVLFFNHQHPLPLKTPSAAHLQQPLPVLATIDLTQPTAQNHHTAHQCQCCDTTSPGQHMVTTTCHIIYTVMMHAGITVRWVSSLSSPTCFPYTRSRVHVATNQLQMTMKHHKLMTMTHLNNHATSHYITNSHKDPAAPPHWTQTPTNWIVMSGASPHCPI